jgi:hypothetical protein
MLPGFLGRARRIARKFAYELTFEQFETAFIDHPAADVSRIFRITGRLDFLQWTTRIFNERCLEF